MAQPQNNMTFYIPDPNGGQPQVIKVVGTTKLPFQLATSSGASTIKTFIKTSAPSEHIPPGTIIQSNKVNNRLIAVPSKSGGNIQNIRGPMIVPVSGVQIKPVQSGEHTVASILPGRSSTATISSPMVIKTQSRSLAMSTSSISNSIPTSINLSQININKHGQHQTIYSAPLLQAHLKQSTGISSKPQSFSIKTQSSIHSHKPPELNLLPQKQTHEINTTQKIKVPPPLPRQPQILQQQSIQTQGISPPKSLMNTSILDHSGSRKRHDFDFDYSVESKRRKTEKCGKGLRHFSMKVCEKVQAKGTTSYNEVADELVNEFSESNRANSPAEGANYDQKNIRRRVYDALNVLMAMNIISKEKKEIHWLGLPTNSLQECHNLETERKKRLQKIKLKTQQLQDLILQQIAFKNLVERNRKIEKDFGSPSPNSAIQLPFIIVNTSKKTVIDCSISNDKTEYLFNFDNTFEIHDDIEVLKRMGMALGLEKGKCSASDLEKAKSIVPKTLESYVVELAENHSESQFETIDEICTSQDEELDSAVNSIYNGEFTFEKAGVDNDNLRLTDIKAESISRHSSVLSLSQDQRTESVSPSSFGEYDDDTMEDSDIEIN